ncbi:hypothetical protein [uncultured Tolumonas sp.]|uniref:hypothetical protein n=1 Tax=uncultured Tolumonas sp. TaxID=263765 RepID=UPI00374A8AE5
MSVTGAQRPDLQIHDLRGNVNSRLAKLDAGDYDAIILAAAGLRRLEKADRIRSLLPPELSLPANGQGAVGIECRLDDAQTQAFVSPAGTCHDALLCNGGTGHES